MQSKGAGPVNRVELESQVLCAALRQSCHNKDRVGAFTSVRELSHLFPDLLPPPEKDDEHSNSNKANFYSVLGLKPQSSANSTVAAYLRTVRNFLRTQKVAEARVEYNRILNAGFILRKPRLRLSHDLVVARRWLHEESRLAQMAVQEVTQDRMEAIKGLREAAMPSAELPKAVEPAQVPVSAPAATSVPPMPPLPNLTAPPPAVPDVAPPPAVPAPPAVPDIAPPSTVPPMPVLPAVAQTGADGFSNGVSVPPVPPLPVAAVQPPVVPPIPAVVNEFWDKQQQPSATAVEPPVVATVPPMPPLPNMHTEVAVKDAPASVMTEPAPVYEVPDVFASETEEAPLPPPAAEAGLAGDEAFFAAVSEVPTTESAADVEAGLDVTDVPAAKKVDDDLIEVAPGVFVPASALAEEAKALEAPEVLPSVVNDAAAAAEARAAEEARMAEAARVAAEAAAQQAAFEAAARAAAAKAAAEAAAAQAVAAEAAAKAAAAQAAAQAAAHQVAAQQAAQAAAQQAAQEAAQQAAQAAQQAAMQAAPSAAAVGNGGAPDTDFPPAAVRAQQMPPAEPPAQREPGRIGNDVFVFDESALAPPPQAQAKKVPMIIQLLEAAQFITPVEVQAILAQMAFAPNVPVEKLILNAGYVTQQELASVRLGESLMEKGKINMAQFQVAIYDERTSGLRMAESLQVRGWLSVEVRNAIDEFHKKGG